MNLCIHYGFGDYVICYGLIKELAKSNDEIVLFAIPHISELHIDNIRRLYSSIKNVRVVEDNPCNYPDVKYIGFNAFWDHIKTNPLTPFPEFFYKQAGVPINLIWDNFYFERNMDKERSAYYQVGLPVDYIFLHDDPDRGFMINRGYWRGGIEVIRLGDYPDISILDSLYLVEKAREVHIMNTGLLSFIDQMNIRHNDLNYHKYTRPKPSDQPLLRLNWKIIE